MNWRLAANSNILFHSCVQLNGVFVFDNITEGIEKWLVGLFASAINHSTRPEDRVLAIRWLGQSRDVVASDARSIEKLKQLNALTIRAPPS
jgi:hypothetical protein